MVTIDQVVALAAEIRGGRAPACFADACEVVENTTHGITSDSAEFEQARHAFSAHLGHNTDADFELWAHDTLHGIADLRLHLAQTSRGEPPDWLVHSVSQLRDGTPEWVNRLRVILQTGSWENWARG